MNAKLTALLLGLAMSPAALAMTVLQEARQLLAAGDAGIALVQLDTYLAGKPNDAEARFTRGMALSRLNRNPEAIKAFSELIRDVPQFPEPYNNLGVLLAGAGELNKARAAFEAAIVKNPQYTAAQFNLAEVEVALAIQAYQGVLGREPGNTTAQVKLELLKSLQQTAARQSPAGSAIPAASAAPDIAREAVVATPLRQAPVPIPPAVQVAALAPPQAPSPPVLVDPVTSAEDVAASASAPTVQDTDMRDAVLGTVRIWADAWSKQDAPRVLSLYAREFSPQDSPSRSQWQNERTASIAASKPGTHRVEVTQFTRISEQRARVSFRQVMESDASVQTVNRTMVLQNLGGSWLIVHEQNS
ncbi:MAG: tetratricopeptide repeat protein [Panacagrimonas sp.]